MFNGVFADDHPSPYGLSIRYVSTTDSRKLKCMNLGSSDITSRLNFFNPLRRSRVINYMTERVVLKTFDR